MLQPSQRDARAICKYTHGAFLSYTKTNRNIIMETTTVKDWKAFYTLVNLRFLSEQDFRTIKQATRGEADPNISLLYQTLHHYALYSGSSPFSFMPGHKQLFTLSGNNTVPFFFVLADFIVSGSVETESATSIPVWWL